MHKTQSAATPMHARKCHKIHNAGIPTKSEEGPKFISPITIFVLPNIIHSLDMEDSHIINGHIIYQLLNHRYFICHIILHSRKY
jgi:hypothetical protein